MILDNYDSFTYNLYQCVTSQGCRARVIRNDAASVEEIAAQGFAAIIISPGPGTPDDAGITKELISRLAPTTPILGVCLGHQAIAEVFGAKVVRAAEPVHGKTSLIRHNGRGLYTGLPQPFQGGRYHSLIVEKASLPACLEITAQTEDGVIMGLRHCSLDVEGIQFHPESILTGHGAMVIRNFLAKIK